MATDSKQRFYQFEPLDSSGLFLGLGAAQCALLGTATVAAVLAVTVGAPLPVAALPIVVAGVLSFGRVGGHAGWEWLPLGVRWVGPALARRHRWNAPLPLLPAASADGPALPPCLAGLDIIEVPWRGQLQIGGIRDRHRDTVTALVRVEGSQFITQPSEEQEGMLAGWGEVLAQSAAPASPVTGLFWCELARASSLATHRQWLDAHHEHGDVAHPAAHSYRELLDGCGAHTVEHEIVAGISVSARGEEVAPSVDALIRGLRSAGLRVGDPLGVLGIHQLLRDRLDPCTDRAIEQAGGLADRLGLVTPTSSGPLTVATSWRYVRVDDAFHRTWWIASWPRLPVAPSWLDGFLSDGDSCRTMTVAFVPVPVHQSRRRIERDLVKLESDASTKEEKGRRVNASHQRATEALLDRERELVAGFAEMGYVGLVSVCAHDEDELGRQSRVVEQQARASGVDLRLLDGRQDIAWAAALPLGLAPRSLAAS